MVPRSFTELVGGLLAVAAVVVIAYLAIRGPSEQSEGALIALLAAAVGYLYRGRVQAPGTDEPSPGRRQLPNEFTPSEDVPPEPPPVPPHEPAPPEGNTGYAGGPGMDTPEPRTPATPQAPPQPPPKPPA